MLTTIFFGIAVKSSDQVELVWYLAKRVLAKEMFAHSQELKAPAFSGAESPVAVRAFEVVQESVPEPSEMASTALQLMGLIVFVWVAEHCLSESSGSRCRH